MAGSTSDSPFCIKEKCNDSTVWNTQSHLWVKENYNHGYNMNLESNRLSKHFPSSITQAIQRDERRKDILFKQQRRRFVELMNKRELPADSKSLSSAPKKDAFDLKDLNESLPSASAFTSADNEGIKWKPEQKQKIENLMRHVMRISPTMGAYLSSYISALNKYIPLIADSEKSMNDILKREFDTVCFTSDINFKCRILSLARRAHFRTCKFCKFQELSFGRKEKNQEIQDSDMRDNIPHGLAPSVKVNNNLKRNIEKIINLRNERHCFKWGSEKRAIHFPAGEFAVGCNRKVSRKWQKYMRSIL